MVQKHKYRNQKLAAPMQDPNMVAAQDLMRPVFEAAMVLASHYALKCGREVVTNTDVTYGLMYSGRHAAKLGGLQYPNAWDDDDEEEEGEEEEGAEDGEEEDGEGEDGEDVEVVDETGGLFSRYTGEDVTCLEMNHCFDTWDVWVPETPADKAAKRAIDVFR